MKNIFYILMIGVSVFSCKPEMEEDVDLGPAPTVDFIVDKTSHPNKFKFTNTTTGAFQQKFDLGNGESSRENSFIGYYPFSGDYTIKLVASSKGGTFTSVKTVSVPASDPSYPLCADSNAINISGGCDALEGKTWVLDHEEFATGVGPIGPYQPGKDATVNMLWWHQVKEGAGDCLYDLEVIFKLRGNIYENNNKGVSMYGWTYANAERGMNQAQYSDICLPYTPPVSYWKVEKDTATKQLMLKLTNGGFIMYKEGRSEYEIITLNKDTLFIRHTYSDFGQPDNGYRYWRLLSKK